MGNIYIAASGGGGSGSGISEDCTATKNKVLEGYTAITSDSNDEPVAGTMSHLTQRSSITSYPSNTIPVILGDDAYVGQCNDNITRALIKFGGTGGYIESGTCIGVEQSEMATSAGVTANKILYDKSILGVAGTATSDATASSKYIYNGKTAYVKGYKVTGTMTVNSILSFSCAAYSTTQIMVKWQNPSKGPFSGVVICAKTGGYPTTPDNNRKYTGYGDNTSANGWSSTIIGGLTSGTTYYIRIWSYCTCSAGDMFSSSAKQSTCATIASGRKVFTSSTTWTVPTGVKSINIHCTGPGSDGREAGHVGLNRGVAGGGGGGGCTAYQKNITVNPGQIITISVGASCASNSTNAASSSASSNGVVLVTAKGSPGGRFIGSSTMHYPAYGASDGGIGAKCGLDGDFYEPEIGGSNGGGNLQSTTTREFGTGTLYSAGGGGGGCDNVYSSGSETFYTFPGASGGEGGGGNGGSFGVGANATAGSGSGGGGGSYGGQLSSAHVGGKGGSGNVIITW